MIYAIIRNEKYTKDEMNPISPHNERNKKKNYLTGQLHKNIIYACEVTITLDRTHIKTEKLIYRVYRNTQQT